MSNMLRLCEFCKELKLELGSLHLLLALAEWPLTVGRSMGALARQVGGKGGNIRGLADRLEARGLVTTKRALYDRRRVYCSLTPEGVNVVERLRLAAGGCENIDPSSPLRATPWQARASHAETRRAKAGPLIGIYN